MFAMEEDHGYDAVFVSEVSEYIKCVVLRNPIQIMSCGHHFCHPCFERIENYSIQL